MKSKSFLRSSRRLTCSAITLILLQISIFGLYRVPSRSIEPTLARNQVILVNRLAFGLHVPFINSTIAEWSLPKKSDIIVIQTKLKRRLLKRVLGIPNDLLMIHGHRILVPEGYVFVGIDNSKAMEKGNFGLIPAKNILGKLVIVL